MPKLVYRAAARRMIGATKNTENTIPGPRSGAPGTSSFDLHKVVRQIAGTFEACD